jgi:heterodisulfide reductase subunit C
VRPVRAEISSRQVRGVFVEKLQRSSGENLFSCYQCGKCSAGCPMTEDMDIIPSQVIRLAQMGQEDEVLQCRTIWLCATCYQCGTRCPKGIDFSRIAEALRLMAMGKGVEHCGPDQIGKDVAAEAPQQGLVSTFRKYGL